MVIKRKSGKNSPHINASTELVLEITQFCPQNCIFCSSNAGPQETTILPFEVIKKIIFDAKKLKINSINLSGGEPLSHPEIENILNFLTEMGFEIVIYTCGVLYDNGSLTSLPEYLIKKIAARGNCVLRFNIQASSRHIFEKINGTPGSYKLAMQSLRLCMKYNIPLEAHIVPNLLNLPILVKTIRFLLKLGVHKVKILQFVAQGRGELNRNSIDPTLNPSLYQSNLNILKNEFSPEQVEIGSAFSCWSNANEDCLAGIQKSIITPNNILFPCPAFKSFNGIDLSQRSLFNVVHNGEMSSQLDQIRKNKCFSCMHFDKCDEICLRQILLCKCYQLKIIKETKPNITKVLLPEI